MLKHYILGPILSHVHGNQLKLVPEAKNTTNNLYGEQGACLTRISCTSKSGLKYLFWRFTQYIFWLQIAVSNAFGMQEVKGSGDIPHHSAGFSLIEVLPLLDVS